MYNDVFTSKKLLKCIWHLCSHTYFLIKESEQYKQWLPVRVAPALDDGFTAMSSHRRHAQRSRNIRLTPANEFTVWRRYLRPKNNHHFHQLLSEIQTDYILKFTLNFVAAVGYRLNHSWASLIIGIDNTIWHESCIFLATNINIQYINSCSAQCQKDMPTHLQVRLNVGLGDGYGQMSWAGLAL